MLVSFFLENREAQPTWEIGQW